MRFHIFNELTLIFESLAEDYDVRPMAPAEVYKWMIEKHYLHREPRAKFAFGLFKNEQMVGACTYGMPPILLNKKFDPWPCFELNRVALIEHEEKNLVSYFVAQSLKMFPVTPAIVISFADPNVGHAGTIYQALNFIYTGRSRTASKFMINGKEIPSRSLFRKYGTQSVPELRKIGLDLKVEQTEGKHRYFIFVGDKRQKRSMFEMIKKYYEIQNYPKADQG